MKVIDSKFLTRATVMAPSPFNIRANCVVCTNVSWGMFGWGEADLIALTKSGYLIEGEVKLTKEDFLRDKHKKKFNSLSDSWKKDIKKLYYIVPDYLLTFALENTIHSVISVDTQCNGFRVKVENRGGCNISRKLFIEEKLKLARLASMRYWKDV